MKCDRQLLSAYYDDLLAPESREEIERHLAACDECRQTLASYRNFGAALSSIAVPPVPVSLRVRFSRSLDHGVRPQFGLGLIGPFGALAAAALAFVVVASFAARPTTALAVVAAYPPNGATGVVLDDAIAVEFNSPIEDDALSDLEIRLEPSVPIETTILGSKVVLRPIVPLRPDTQYVVRIERGEKSSQTNQIAILPPPPTAAPLTVNFSTGRNVAAAASATAARGNAPISPTPAPAVALLPAPPATSTARSLSSAVLPAATIPAARPEDSATALVSSRTPSPAACGTATSSRVAFALRGRSELPARLGCAVEIERVVTYDEETSATGLLVAVDDGRSRVTLLPDSRWVAADSVTTSTPTSAPTRPPILATVSPSPTVSTGASAETPPVASASDTPPTATPSLAASSTIAPATTPAATPTASAPGAAGVTASPTPPPAAGLTATAVATVPSGDATARPKSTVVESGTTPSPTVVSTSAPGATLTSIPATAVSATATSSRQPTVTTAATSTATPTATAVATSVEPSRFAWVQVFEHGSVLLAPTADGSLGYVLLDDGSWSRLAAFSPLPLATSTATPKRALTPTLVPSPAPVGSENGRNGDARSGTISKGEGDAPTPLASTRVRVRERIA